MIGLIFAGMLFATLATLLLPLFRSTARADADTVDYEIGVYRDQLCEIEDEIKDGLISLERAAASRLEIQRRILAAPSFGTAPPPPHSHRTTLIVALLIVLFISVGAWQLYIRIGAPGLSDQPYAARQNDPDMQLNAATEIIAATLASNPNAQGFNRLAGMYYALHRYDRAVETYRKALDLDANDAETWSELGESLVMKNDGAVVMEAQDAFKTALAHNSNEPRARFYIGLAEAQIGNDRKAISIWRDIERNAPPDAPWLRMVQDNIRLYAKQGGFDPASVLPLAAH